MLLERQFDLARGVGFRGSEIGEGARGLDGLLVDAITDPRAMIWTG